MKKYRLIAIFFVGLLAITACDKVEAPYGEKIPPIPAECEQVTFSELNMDSVKKVVLLEEVTGIKCPNCPIAHERLHELEELYGYQLAVTGIHASANAAPSNPPLDYDLRTDDGNEISDYLFGQTIPFAPTAFIQRQYNDINILDDGYFYNLNDWQTKIDQLLQQSPEAFLQMINVYDSVENSFCCHVKTTMFEDYNGDINLSIYLVEDSIIGAQDVEGDIVEDYVHMRVFRKSLLNVWGVPIGINLDEESAESVYKFDLEDAWIPKNCSVVAFISDSETREVIQATSEHLIK